MPEFAVETEPEKNSFYTIALPIDLAQSVHVELVFEPDGTIARKIDGERVGTWVKVA